MRTPPRSLTALVVSISAISCGAHPGPPRIYPDRVYVLPNGSAKYEIRGDLTNDWNWSIKYDRSQDASVDNTGLYTAGAQANNTDVVGAALPSGEMLTATAHVTMTPLEPLYLDEDYLYVVTGANHQFTVTGGTGPYFWTIHTNTSGCTLDDAGLYHAGETPGVDVLQVDDSAGQAAQITVTISPRAVNTCNGGCCGCGGSNAAQPLAGSLAFVAMRLWRRRSAPARRT